MPEGLVRLQKTGQFHFITFSCYHRLPYLARPHAMQLFEEALERARKKYRFVVAGYVAMPEHVHLVVSEPKKGMLDDAIKAIKLSVSLRTVQRPFWQARYYDFNVFTKEKRVEKLRYMHRNPVVRGLVTKPEDWKWSSFRHYATGLIGTVEIESEWTSAPGREVTERIRNKRAKPLKSPSAGVPQVRVFGPGRLFIRSIMKYETKEILVRRALSAAPCGSKSPFPLPERPAIPGPNTRTWGNHLG
jgi:putative transposase